MGTWEMKCKGKRRERRVLNLSSVAMRRGWPRRNGLRLRGAGCGGRRGPAWYLVEWSVLGRQQGGRQQARLGAGSKVHGKQTRQIEMVKLWLPNTARGKKACAIHKSYTKTGAARKEPQLILRIKDGRVPLQKAYRYSCANPTPEVFQ